MKKLMIAAAVAMLGIAANAANYAWSTAMADRTLEAYAEGTVYLMSGSAKTFADAVLAAGASWGTTFDTLVAGAVNSATATDEGALSDPAVGTWDSKNEFVVWETTDTSYQMFQVIKDADGFLIAADISGTTKDVGNTALAFQLDEPSIYGDTVKTYQGAGWYTAVPEPTSGLLLLLGMAGLALRRRRA